MKFCETHFSENCNFNSIKKCNVDAEIGIVPITANQGTNYCLHHSPMLPIFENEDVYMGCFPQGSSTKVNQRCTCLIEFRHGSHKTIASSPPWIAKSFRTRVLAE